MRPESFQQGFPGRLVQVTGYDRKIVKGVPQATPVQTVAFVPSALPPTSLERDAFIGRVSGELLHAQSQVSLLEGTLAALPAPDLLIRPFRLREAKLSSKIENTFASVEELALLDAGRPAPRNEVAEVHNYLDALQLGVDSKLPLSVRLFEQIHAVLLKDVRGDDKRPGQLRDRLVCIGDEDRGFAGARFVPPPHGETLLACLRDLERFLNSDALYESSERPARFPPLIEMAFAHYQFETIHPFNDGNGRLGRLLVPLQACHFGLLSRPVLYVSAYLEKYRARYYDLLLRVSTHNDWQAWTEFFLSAVASQAADAVTRCRKLQALRQRYLTLVTTKRASALATKLVDMLFRYPAVNTATVCAGLNISRPAANKHLNGLEAHGVLREVTGGSYGKVWLASEILAAVEEEPEIG
jgi:Fic family protein